MRDGDHVRRLSRPAIRPQDADAGPAATDVVTLVDLAARVDRLEAEAAARNLLAAYCHAVDAADVDALARLFDADAVFRRDGREPLVGRDAILAHYREVLGSGIAPTHHYAVDTQTIANDGGRIELHSDYVVTMTRGDDLVVGWGAYVDVILRSPVGLTIGEKESRMAAMTTVPGGWAAARDVRRPWERG